MLPRLARLSDTKDVRVVDEDMTSHRFALKNGLSWVPQINIAHMSA